MSKYLVGDGGNDMLDLRNAGYPGATGAHRALGYGGNDEIHGSYYDDILDGGSGDDKLYGYDGSDFLGGFEGADQLYGGNGNDYIYGGSGDASADRLDGGGGNDFMSGGRGGDTYIHGLYGGVDTINDGRSEGGMDGWGGGIDIVQFTGVKYADLGYMRPSNSNDLWLSSMQDLADGSLDDGVILQNFYARDANTFIEQVRTSDNVTIDLSILL